MMCDNLKNNNHGERLMSVITTGGMSLRTQRERLQSVIVTAINETVNETLKARYNAGFMMIWNRNKRKKPLFSSCFQLKL